MKIYNTERLILRECNIEDLDSIYELSNYNVMEYLSDEEVTKDSIMKQIESYKMHHVAHGFGALSCINKTSDKLIGIAILRYHSELKQFHDELEIGWRISSTEWGKGYAGEIANKLFEISFDEYNFDELIAIVSTKNSKSIRALEKLEMIHSKNFVHQFRSAELNPYKIYSMSKERWKSKIGYTSYLEI